MSKTYDPQDMSQEEYDALLEDLQRLGVLSSGEVQILRYGASSRLNGIWEASSAQPDLSHHFKYCNGNLLDWARFRASYECLDQSGNRYRDGTALLFDKLYCVLTQLMK